MDKIEIKSLSVLTTIGVHAWEQRIKQRLLIDLSLSLDVSLCQDALNNTIDYEDLCQQITTYVESTSFLLIEAVANAVAQYVKDHFAVMQLTICVNKPHAIKNAGNVSVTVSR